MARVRIDCPETSVPILIFEPGGFTMRDFTIADPDGFGVRFASLLDEG